MKTFVTPEMAQEWLSHNTSNRSLSLNRSRELATDMLAKRWNSENRQGIQIGSDGDLVDGQHRLTAVILASNDDASFRGIDMWVYKDVPASVRGVVDFNRVRSVGDILHIEGHKNGTIASAAATYVLNWLDGEKINATRSKTEKHEFILKNLDMLHYAELATSARGYAVPSAIAAVLFLATRSRDADGPMLDTHAEAFVEGVANGAGLKLRDARLALRNWMYNQRGGRGGQAAAFAATLQAWNLFVAGLEVTTIRTNIEEKTGLIELKPIVGAPERGAGMAGLSRVTLERTTRQVIDEGRLAIRREREAQQEAAM